MNYDEVHDKLKAAAAAAVIAETEACGFVGRKTKLMDAEWYLYPLTNTTTAPDRYETDPAEQIEVFAQMQASGIRLWGVYHTHKEHALPGPTDVKYWNYPPELKMVIATPDQVAVYVNQGDGLVVTLWPR